jgi:MoaA/NifB/PqqE/SkfB family radical SAM enzyme
MHSNHQINSIFESGIKSFFRNLLFFNIRNFISIPFLLSNASHQYKASRKRLKMLQQNVTIPPVLALTITNKCNLNCKGCYLKSQNRETKKEFTDEEIKRLLNEADELGTSIILLLGGEPLMRDVFKLTGNHKHMIYSMFTNSTLIDEKVITKLKKNRHIVPVLSLEGTETDIRRGFGVLDNIEMVAKELKAAKVLYGISLTVTRNNFEEVCNDAFVQKHKKNGAVFFSYFKYVPIDKNTMNIVLTPEQDKKFNEFVYDFRKRNKTLILTPANEIKFGGCMGAGKGVAHINYDGAMEVCPFAPFSDVSVKKMHLKDALQSKLFQNLRRHQPQMIQQGLSMCTLWKDRNWDNAIKTNDFSVFEK